MASNHTTNYNLNQWEATDKVLRTDFNEDNAKIDAALKGLSDQVAGKAAQSAVNSLTQTVNGKADAATVSSLSQTVAQKADAATVTALSQTVAQKADQADVDELESRAGTKLIQKITLSQSQDIISVDLTQINWSQWATVTIQVCPVLSGRNAYHVFSDLSTSNSSVYFTGDSISQQFLGILFPYFNAGKVIQCLVWPKRQDCATLMYSETYAELTTLQVDAVEQAFQPGTVVELWGNK